MGTPTTEPILLPDDWQDTTTPEQHATATRLWNEAAASLGRELDDLDEQKRSLVERANKTLYAAFRTTGCVDAADMEGFTERLTNWYPHWPERLRRGEQYEYTGALTQQDARP
jgi:hypothetical protein